MTFHPIFGADPFAAPATGPFGTRDTSGGGTVPRNVPGALGATNRPATRLPIEWERVRILMQAHRDNAAAQAHAAGYTTPVRCSTFSAFRCSLYALVPSVRGMYDLQIAARPPGGATGLLANLAGKQRLAIANMGAVTLYPVAWIDAPGGPVWGWMVDGGFGVG